MSCNNQNIIIWYESGDRYEKRFCDFYNDVMSAIAELNLVNADRVGILGPTCYNWLVLDISCILGGFESLALPEGLPQSTITTLLQENPVDIVLVCEGFESKLDSNSPKRLTFSRSGKFSFTENTNVIGPLPANKIRVTYTQTFSSGSTGKPKPFKKSFGMTHAKSLSPPIAESLKAFADTFGDNAPIWRMSGNCIIIFMPFSHLQQRLLALRALLFKGNIVLSDRNNCLNHLLKESPNVMIAAPAVFEQLSAIIKSEVDRFGFARKLLFRCCITLGLNKFPRTGPIFALFQLVIGKYIRSLSGGRPDVFLTGNAKINKDALVNLWNVGIKVYEIYSQTELGTIAANTPICYRLGSVGKPIQEISFSKSGEVLVRVDQNEFDKIGLPINREGYVHTGDLGHFDEDGFLYIDGRVDGVIVMRNGLKVLPEPLEILYRKIPLVITALIYSCPSDGLILGLLIADQASSDSVEKDVRVVALGLAESERPNAIKIVYKTESKGHTIWTTNGKVMRLNLETVFKNSTKKIKINYSV